MYWTLSLNHIASYATYTLVWVLLYLKMTKDFENAFKKITTLKTFILYLGQNHHLLRVEILFPIYILNDTNLWICYLLHFLRNKNHLIEIQIYLGFIFIKYWWLERWKLVLTSWQIKQMFSYRILLLIYCIFHGRKFHCKIFPRKIMISLLWVKAHTLFSFVFLLDKRKA